MGKSHALRPLLCWKSLAGWVLCIVMNVIHVLHRGLLNPTQPICNLTRESRAINDCSVADMPQIKKWGGEVEAQCLIKIGKRKKSVVLKIKLSQKGKILCLFYLYKSKYSTINIQFSYLNFKKFHLHPRQETNKQKSGAI